MPGSGKSTVGIILAKMTSREFIDTDILIQSREKRSLQEIIDTEGPMSLRKIEEEVLLDVTCENHVVATGGSAAYSDSAMVHLQAIGTIFFLHADLQTLKTRITNFATRGLAKRPEQSFSDLFNERFQLYQKYADRTVESSGHTQDEVCTKIIEMINGS